MRWAGTATRLTSLRDEWRRMTVPAPPIHDTRQNVTKCAASSTYAAKPPLRTLERNTQICNLVGVLTLHDLTPVKWAVGNVMRRHSSRSDVSRRACPTAHLTRTK